MRLAATFVLTLLARRVDLPRPFDAAFLLGMALQAVGNALGLFERYGPYDAIVHFVLPLAVAPCVYLLLVRLEVAPDPATRPPRHHRAGVFVVTFALELTVGSSTSSTSTRPTACSAPTSR